VGHKTQKKAASAAFFIARFAMSNSPADQPKIHPMPLE
jgi:hypothetical protein